MVGHDDSTKKVIHATICEPGAKALRAFCVQHGVTMTAFLDGLGHSIEPFIPATAPDLEMLAPSLAAALASARQIDAARRTRG